LLKTKGLFFPSAEVAFGGLDRRVAEQQLDLLEVAAGLAAELGAGAAQVVGRELAERGLARVCDYHLPDALFILHIWSGDLARF
jgi:hypothetical protein